MARKTRWSLAAVPLGAAFVIGASCNVTTYCFGVHPGDRIAITIVDVDTFGDPPGTEPDASSPGTCEFGFDVSKGQVLVASVVKSVLANDQCLGAIVQIDPFSGWTWTLAMDNSNSETATRNVAAGAYDATNGTCTGNVAFALQGTPSEDPFAASVPGQRPNVTMSRQFNSSTPACPSCFGTFVVNLKKL